MSGFKKRKRAFMQQGQEYKRSDQYRLNGIILTIITTFLHDLVKIFVISTILNKKIKESRSWKA
jgi:hypothetical protein